MKRYITLLCFHLFLISGHPILGQNKVLPAFSYLTKSVPLSQETIFTLKEQPQAIQTLYGFTSKEIELRPLPGKSAGSSRFRLMYKGIPIHNAYLTVRESFNRLSAEWTYPDLPLGLLTRTEFDHIQVQPGSCLVYNAGKWQLLHKRTGFRVGPPAEAFLYFEDENRNVLFSEDWLLRATSGPDSTIKACVFKPDPVSKLRQSYGGLLRDRSDSNSVLLQRALDTVDVRVRFGNDTFQLTNAYFRLGEFSPPVRKPARFQSADSFLLSRERPEFEEVNIFYHLNSFRKFQDSLGFSSLADYPVAIDAHGMSGNDQSAYSPLQDILAFGEGNVDDGEDAGVVVHEYGHVLSHSALPFGNSGLERRSIEEGICDYLAGSYAKTLSSFRWQDLFKWDGHNEFWLGRTLNTSKMYPDQMVGEMHRDGEIFSSALMNLEGLVGRATTHRLVLASLPLLLPNFTMPQAARTILNTDSTLFGGTNSILITQVFNGKGIDPTLIIVSNSGNTAKSNVLNLRRNSYPGGGWLLLKPENVKGMAFLSNQSGRILKTVSLEMNETSVRIPEEGLPAGVYFLRTEYTTGFQLFKLIVLP